jgi:hypothetical protein
MLDIFSRHEFRSMRTVADMPMRKIKTEHNGAKNGGGFWGKRAEAKRIGNKIRRADEKKLVTLTGESSLEKDWFRPEEDDAWRDL